MTMPVFFIHLRNSEFRSRDEGGEYADAQAALAAGLASAVILAGDEINGGSRNSAIEVTITKGDGIDLLTSVVATSVAVLMPNNPGSSAALR